MPMFWNTLMGINSFLVIPATGIFLIYAFGRGIIHGQWTQFGISILLLLVAIVAEVILAIMDDA